MGKLFGWTYSLMSRRACAVEKQLSGDDLGMDRLGRVNVLRSRDYGAYTDSHGIKFYGGEIHNSHH